MRRTKLSWLLLGGMGIALCACGDSGSPTGLPPAGFGYGSDEGPYGSFNDPPTSDTEMAGSWNEAATCGSEQRLSLSDVLLNLSLPFCEFEASCSESYSPTPPPQGVPGQGTTPADGTIQTRDVDVETALNSIPDFCLELAVSRTGEGLEASDCELTKALGQVLKEIPACDDYVVLPEGYCAARLDRCFTDLIQAGCASYLSGRYPTSCGEIFSVDESNPQPVPDQPN